MATETYTPIASITLGSSASSVTFSSIPQDYRDLVLVADVDNSVSALFEAELNGDTDSNYSRIIMFGTGSTTGSSSATSTALRASGGASESLIIINFMDYSATDKHKSALSRDNNASGEVGARAHRYASTSAITSIVCSPSSGNFNSGSTLALYGIAS